jgi:phenylacetate-coenzyme A ligase PaaK-like adenylate-forming protein
MRIIDRQKFAAIVRHARQTNPFYAEWIPPGGPVPILTRAIFQANNDRILNGQPVTGTTSGSTGTPVRISSGAPRSAMEARDHRMVMGWLGGRLPRTEFVFPRSEQRREGLYTIHTPVPEQLAILKARHAAIGAVSLVTYPSNAVLLAQAILDAGGGFEFIRRVGLMSEAVDPGQMALVQRAFPNAHIWRTYSAIEFGAIGYECPHEPGFYHLMSHKLGIEVVDDDGEPAAPGAIGRLVLTDYFNRRMPIIRYDIGDLAAFGRCPCGKIPFPALREVLGKVRGCLLHPNGRRIPFVDLSVALRDLPGMRQYQVIQEERTRFTVNLVAPPSVEAGVRAAFAKEFGAEPEIAFRYLDEIPRDPSGKFYISICKV